MPRTKFEAVFRAFVEDFGGEVIPEGAERSADYVFRQYNVVAELKCLVVDQAAGVLRKRDELLSLHRVARSVEPGPDDILLPVRSPDGEEFAVLYNESFEKAWVKVLHAPIESLVRDAHRQIRATKERLSIPSAHGVMLVFNEGNFLHVGSPQHFARLLGYVIQKGEADERRFPHIQGAVCFSFRTVETFDEQTQRFMPFWLPAQVRGDSVEAVKHFQDDLKKGWYQYIKRMSGVSVVSHHRETGWPDS
jgi:hypothetical protein